MKFKIFSLSFELGTLGSERVKHISPYTLNSFPSRETSEIRPVKFHNDLASPRSVQCLGLVVVQNRATINQRSYTDLGRATFIPDVTEYGIFQVEIQTSLKWRRIECVKKYICSFWRHEVIFDYNFAASYNVP